MEFLSECCDALPIGELDRENELGFCGRCKDKAVFYDDTAYAYWIGSPNFTPIEIRVEDTND
jgi:hypothetical protein